ncbi:hypothetical protein CCP1ISM_660001 [Azospirillaceae bacterium]
MLSRHRQKNNKRIDDKGGRGLAIQQWELDLAYMKKTYYDGRYDRDGFMFVWPVIT